MLEEHNFPFSTDILTDRKLAIVNAIGNTFPAVPSVICRWHLNQHVLAKERAVLGQVPVDNPLPGQEKCANTWQTDVFMPVFYDAANVVLMRNDFAYAQLEEAVTFGIGQTSAKSYRYYQERGMVHSALFWQVRCIGDSSGKGDNTPPNLQRDGTEGPARIGKLNGLLSGTKTPPWLPPQHGARKPKTEITGTCTRTDDEGDTTVRASATQPHDILPVLLETPPSPLRSSRSSRLLRGATILDGSAEPMLTRTINGLSYAVNCFSVAATRSEGHFLPAGWPYRVAHLLRSMTQPGWSTRRCPTSAGVTVPHRAVWGPAGTRLCNSSGCPYDASARVFQGLLARNARTRQLSVIAAEDIETGEVLGQYFGELEHVSVDQAHRPRNEGYRLVMTQLPERPSHPVRVAINAVQFGGLIRLVNHSCAPKGKSSRSTMEVISDLCVDAI
ncbi:MULE transposase domain [Phytophthora cactorum]|nr:MULE transposase domain [Phytophthora cactorum]